MATNYFTSLPAPEIRNALVNFQPMTNAFEAVRDQNNENRNALMRQQQMDAQKEERTYQRGRDQVADQRQYAKQLGDFGVAVQREQDPTRRQALWNRTLAFHKQYFPGQTLTPEEMDINTGPTLLAAEVGKVFDPRDDKLQDLQIQKTQAEINALNNKQDDPIRQLLVERLRNRGGAPAQPGPTGPQQPMLQPQSFNGDGPMPGLQLIADEQVTPPVESQPQAGLIETPFGPMTEKDARDLAGPMLLDPKYQAAGKAILESITSAGGGGLAKPAANQLDERTISAASTLGRLQSIRKQFRPEFQQIPERLKLMGASWGAALGGKLSPALQKQLGDFAAYKATAYDNFNQLLKELSGTAVSAQELARQKIVQPDPGDTIWNGDDPVTFQSKLDQGEKIMRAAIARMNFMRTRGLQFNKDTAEQFLRLEDVPAAIDRRGAEIEQQLRNANPKIDPMQLDRSVRQQLKREFGV